VFFVRLLIAAFEFFVGCVWVPVHPAWDAARVPHFANATIGLTWFRHRAAREVLKVLKVKVVVGF
jgi:hypothetical protein